MCVCVIVCLKERERERERERESTKNFLSGTEEKELNLRTLPSWLCKTLILNLLSRPKAF